MTPVKENIAMFYLTMSLRACFISTCLLLSFASAHAQTNAPAPKFNGTTIPTPPQQSAPWTAPSATTELPEKLLSATGKLFEQGMADPRGCEYREIEVAAGSVWGGAWVFKTHGWVLPSSAGGQRFAVGWNGLVYPLFSVGKPADLRADILSMVKDDEELRARWAKERPDFPFFRLHNAWPEGLTLAETSLMPLKVCLLLRLGEVELAQRVWTTWMAGMRAESGNDVAKDPYLLLATDWAWSLFDRAVTTHMRGDDKLSLLSARALIPIENAVEAEAERRGLRPVEYVEANQKPRYLTFLSPLPTLLADQERRASERQHAEAAPRKRALEIGLNNFPDAASRIEALIRDLDEVAARQSGQPGGVDLGEDPIVQALIAQGDAAVEPLLKVLENDTRLTRSVHFGRDFFYSRSLLGTHEAAYVALVGILKTSFFNAASTGDNLTARGLEGRRMVAAQIRAYMKEYGGVSLEERWYRILANDKASLDQWLQAASNIVRPTNVEILPSSMAFTTTITRPAQAGESISLRGAALRQKTAPTVSQLLIKRMNESAASEYLNDQQWLNSLEAATDFGVALGIWDGKTHLEDLRLLTERLRKLYALESNKQKRPSLLSMIVRLYLRRCAIPDPQAIDEYAQWVQTVKPEDTDYDTMFLFEPVFQYGNAPAIKRAINRMFSDSASLWLPLIQRDDRRSSYDVFELVETPLLNFEALSQQVLKGLADKSVIATLQPRSPELGGGYNLKVENNYAAVLAGAYNSTSAVIQVADKDPHAPQLPLSPVSLRVCDVYAWKVSHQPGAPKFEIYWTKAERDKAIAAVVAFLHEHQGRFGFSTRFGMFR